MALFKDINNAGSGIAKNTQRKKGLGDFFKIFGRKFWNLFTVNMLYMLFYIPLALSIVCFRVGGLVGSILTIVFFLAFAAISGPATGGFFRVMRAYSLEQPLFMTHTFFKTFKRDYFKNLAWGIVNILVVISAYCSFKIYPKYFGDSPLKYVCLAVVAFIVLSVAMMDFYFFFLSTSTQLSMKDTVKDSFCLVSIGLKKNLLTLVISVVVFAAFFVFFYVLGILFMLFFLPASFIGLVIAYNCYPYIQKYIINPYYREKGEVNPELEFEYAKDTAIFKDMGGKEKPVVIEKKVKTKRRGGKDIS